MKLNRIRVDNLQTIQHYVFDIKGMDLIFFKGENSNGKSIVTRTTLSLVKGTIFLPGKRAAYITRGCTYGEIEYTRDDGATLLLHLAHAAASTYVKYTNPYGEETTRYLADKKEAIFALNKAFGWHYDSTLDIALNIAEAEDALLFYKTKGKANAKILETATVDESAERRLVCFEEVLKEARRTRDEMRINAQAQETVCVNLKVINEAAEEETIAKMKKCLSVLKCMHYPVIKDIVPVPNVYYINLEMPRIPKLKYPPIYDIDCNIPDISVVAKEIEMLKSKKCPTCGRGWE